MREKTISFLIIAFALLVSFIIVNSRNSLAGKDNPFIVLKTLSSDNSLNYTQSSLDESVASKVDNKPVDTQYTLNLTKVFASQLIPLLDSVQLSEGRSNDLNQILSTTDIQAVFNQNKYTFSNIKIGDNSIPNQKDYLENLLIIGEKSFRNIKGRDFFEYIINPALTRNDFANLNLLIRDTQNYINEILQLEVPSSFSKVHLSNLNLWNQSLIVFKSIANVDQDPLKSLFALSYYVDNIIPKILDVNQVLAELYNTYNK